MNIAYLGNGDHSHCTEVHLEKTLRGMGHEVTHLQENRASLQQIESVASQCDLLIYTRTWGLPDEATKLWRRLESRGCQTISYHLDLWLGIQRQAEVEAKTPFWTTGWVFSPDGDPKSQKWFDQHGIKHVWMPPAVYEAECKPGNRRARYLKHPVIFVGSQEYHKEWPYRNQLITSLTSMYGQRFKRYGGGVETVRGKRLNDLYASATVVVGDSLCLGFNHRNYWSDRATETLGRGGFLIHPYIQGMEDFFTDGEHLRYYQFGDFEGLQKMIDYYLEHPQEAREIANRGQVHVRANHTYTHRLTDTLEILKKAGAISG